MSVHALRPANPPVFLTQRDHDALCVLLDRFGEESHGAQLLGEELNRAAIIPDGSPKPVVRLGSVADIETMSHVRRVRLCLPAEANVDEGALSVLSSAGAALIGLSPGATFRWQDEAGRPQWIKVVRILGDATDPDDPPAAA